MIPLIAGPELDKLIHCTLLGRTDKVRGYSSNPNAARYLQRKLMAMGRWTHPGGKLSCLAICEVALKAMAHAGVLLVHDEASYVPPDLAAIAWETSPVPDTPANPAIEALTVVKTVHPLVDIRPDPQETRPKAPRTRTKRPDRAQAFNAFQKTCRANGVKDTKEIARLWQLEKAKPRSE